MQPIKVLHVIDSLGRGGGAERQLALEINGLNPTRFASYVCYLHPPTYLATLFKSMGVPLHELEVDGMSQWIHGVRKLRRLVKSWDIELIHTTLFESDVIGGLAGRLTGIPVVSTLASTVYEPEWLIDNTDLNRMKLMFSRLVRKFVARYLDNHLIAVSAAVKNSAMRQLRLPTDKITVIHRALSSEWLEGKVTQGLGERIGGGELPSAFPVLISVGRLEPPKGHHYLIESMPNIIRDFPRALLLIVGEGKLYPQLKKLTESLGLNNKVLFLGQRGDIQHLLGSSDVFVLSSLYEGCPNALLEAMAMGLPSVCFNIEAVYEVTQGGRFASLVPLRDVRALAEAVIKLASNIDGARLLALEAREETRNDFASARCLSQLMDVYDRCLATNGV